MGMLIHRHLIEENFNVLEAAKTAETKEPETEEKPAEKKPVRRTPPGRKRTAK